MTAMTLDEEPVIISEEDFAPTPSPSPVSVPPGEDADEPDSRGGPRPREEPATPGSNGDYDDATGADELNISNIISGLLDPPADGSATVSDDEAEPIAEPADAAPPAAEEILPVVEDGDVSAAEGMDAPSDDGRPGPEVPSARQIVSIGTEDDSYAFTFHEEEMNAILSKVPPGWKVCVVSVVGAFRTGKSFLLSWFLRYLEAHCVRRGGSEANSGASEADGATATKWFERVQTLNQREGSFDWRGGKERNTTGMWMWSDPYFLPRKSGGDVAILLVDTQGMFDHETTVGLTASIFGLSTLLSSYQIYNVDKRIQEDNLQQLALFSEYGRMAFEAEKAASMAGAETDTDEGAQKASDASKKTQQPFQKIEFLVRDWQNFDTEDEEDITSMEMEMASYLEHVTAQRAASDLKDTRDQINSCFEDISCFMMTHPGFAVIKNKYEGDVSKIEPLFMRLMNRYCERVFDTNGIDGAPRLEPKTVRGRELSAVELGTYIKSYAQMFEEIGANFPKAETMLEATSKANNTNAVTASVEAYTDLMTVIAGPQANDYHRPEELMVKHQEASQKALLAFDDMANFGSRSAIVEARDRVMQKIGKDFDLFASLNEGRNPLQGFETYLLPLAMAGISFILRWIADFTCSGWSQTCRASSELFSHIYMVVFFFLVIVGSTKVKQIKDLVGRAKSAYGFMTESPTKDKHD